MSLNNNQMLCCLRVNQVNDELFPSKLKRHTINSMHWCILLTLVFYINNGDASLLYIYIYMKCTMRHLFIQRQWTCHLDPACHLNFKTLDVMSFKK